MDRVMLAPSNKVKIFNPIISTVAIPVMNLPSRWNRPIMGSPDQPMFSNPPALKVNTGIPISKVAKDFHNSIIAH